MRPQNYNETFYSIFFRILLFLCLTIMPWVVIFGDLAEKRMFPVMVYTFCAMILIALGVSLPGARSYEAVTVFFKFSDEQKFKKLINAQLDSIHYSLKTQSKEKLIFKTGYNVEGQEGPRRFPIQIHVIIKGSIAEIVGPKIMIEKVIGKLSFETEICERV